VLHLLIEGKTGEVLVNLQSDERRVQTAQFELWSDRSFDRVHFVTRIDGQTADVLLPEDNKGGFSAGATADPALTAFWTGYREALDDGDAQVERTGTIAGRAVYWLRFSSVQKGVPGTEVAIDQETYKPVALGPSASTAGDVARILVAETIPFDPADFKRVGSSLFGGSGSTSSSGGSASPSPQSTQPVVKAPWLTSGQQIAGLKLSSVDSSTTTTRDQTIDGIELQYGTGPFGPDSLTIDELPKPDDPAISKHVPPGWISIQKGQGADGKSTFSTWNGTLVKDGIYVTIETGAGEDAVIEAARALRPAR
jgi:hypothetical protein